MSVAPITRRPLVLTPLSVERPSADQKPAPAAASPVRKQAEVIKARDTFEPTAVAKKLVTATRTPAEPVKPQSVSGEERAKQEVDVKTVADRRGEIEGARKKLREETTRKADDVFAMADGRALVPKGTEVKKLSDTEAELVRRDDKGELLERTVATRGPEGAVTLDTASYRDGATQRDRVEMRADGSSNVQRAERKNGKNQVAAFESFDDIAKSRDRDLTYTRNEVRTGKEGLELDEYSQAEGAVTGSRSTFRQQKGGGDIDNKLEHPFDFKKPVDRAETYTYSIPAPGADGSQGNPHYSRTQYFSQDNVQAISFVERELDGHKKYAGEGPHTREDLERVRDEYAKHGGEKYDANDGKPPKRWLMEVQKDPNHLQTQTFIEGTPKATIITNKTRDGNQVREDYHGKTFKPDAKKAGELVDVSGESSHTYAQDGSIEKMDSKRNEADGSTVEQRYNSARKPTDAGLELSESLETKLTRDGKTDTSLKEDTSLLSGQGAQLVGSRNTVTSADGRQAVHELGTGGERMTLSGPGGKDPRDITDLDALKDDAAGKELLLQAGISTSSTIRDYTVNGGARSLEMLHELSKDSERLPSLASKVLGNDSLKRGLEGAKGAGYGLGGVAGAVAGGMQLAEGIRDKNVPEIFKGLLDTGLGAVNLYNGGKAFHGAIKGVTDTALDATGTVSKGLGKWASVLGNPKVSQAVTSSVFDSVKGMGGLGRVAGTAAEIGAKGLSALESAGGIMNVAGAAVGTGLGIMDIVNGAKDKDGAQIAKGAVGIAGGIGGAIAAGAVGGPLGIAVGLGIGLLTYGFGKLMDLISDKKHKIAELQIG